MNTTDLQPLIDPPYGIEDRRGSDWYGAVVVRVTHVASHPDPETTSLEVVRVFAVDGDENSGIPVVVRKGEYRVGQLAVYTGIDSLVPTERARFAFLARDSKVDQVTGERVHRVRARKIRGVYSEGLLTPARPLGKVFDVPGRGEEADRGEDRFPECDNGFLVFREGRDLTLQLGVRKYLPACEMDLVQGMVVVDDTLHADLSCGLALYRGPGSTLVDWLTSMVVRPGASGWNWLSRAHVVRSIKAGYVQIAKGVCSVCGHTDKKHAEAHRETCGSGCRCSQGFRPVVTFDPDYTVRVGDEISFVIHPGASLRPNRPGASTTQSDAVHNPHANKIPCYDLEALRRHAHVFQPGEQVAVYEKIHGANGRAYHDGERLWVGSRNQWKKRPEDPEQDLWWKAAARYQLEEKLAKVPGLVFYFEVFGQVQDLKYGAKPGEVFLAVFDVYIPEPFGELFSVWRTAEGIGTLNRSLLDDEEAVRYPTDYPRGVTSSEVVASGVTFSPDQKGWISDLQKGILCDVLELPEPPMLYLSQYDQDVVMPLRNGPSMWPGANHVREGFVVRPASVEPERVIPRVGRPVMKVVGEQYKLRS